MSARNTQRITALVSALAERRVLHLRQAAELLGVSEMTVRRDIADHPDQFAYFGGHIMSPAQVEGNTPLRDRDRGGQPRRGQARGLRPCRAAISARTRPSSSIAAPRCVHLVELIPDELSASPRSATR